MFSSQAVAISRPKFSNIPFTIREVQGIPVFVWFGLSTFPLKMVEKVFFGAKPIQSTNRVALDPNRTPCLCQL